MKKEEISKIVLKGKAIAELAHSCAAKVCRGGEDCFCSYECKKDKTSDFNFGRLPLIGTEKTCPLERYNIDKPDSSADSFGLRSNTDPSSDELFSICAMCEHAVVTYVGNKLQWTRDLKSACLDCPIKQTEDAIVESVAESRC